MRWKIIGMVLVIGLLVVHPVQALPDWDIYTNETIETGAYNVVQTHDNAVVSITGSTVSINELWTVDQSNVTIMAGTVVGTLFGSSLTQLYGGNFNIIKAFGQDSVHIYGLNFVFTPQSGIPSRGILTGEWQSGTSFSINLRDCPPYYEGETPPDFADAVVLHIVPEPISLSIFTSGFLFLLLRKKR